MCKKTCNTAIELQSALSQIGDLQRRIDNQRKTIGEHQGDTKRQRHQIEQLAEQIDAAAALAANLRRERDEYRGLAEERAGTIADLRGRGILRQVFALEEEVEQVRGQLAEMTAERDNLARDLEARNTAHASDHIELEARREECEKLNTVTDNQTREIIGLNNEVVTLRRQLADMTADRDDQIDARDNFERVANEWMQQAQQERMAKIATRDQRDQEALARQRVQIELNKAADRIATLEAAHSRTGSELSLTRDQLQDARRQLNDQAADLGRVDRVEELLANAPMCHCDDLQEQLANLHRAGKSVLLGMTMNSKAVTFIEALTRAGDRLEELVGE